MENNHVIKKIVITGGGSGGHTAPLRAVIPALITKIPNLQIIWIGGKGIEKTIAKDLKVPHITISTGKLRRYFSFKNITDIFRVMNGIIQSIKVLKKEKPDLVFSTGGSVSVPVVIAAKTLNIKTIIHEQTVVVGLANKINSLFATKILLGFDSSKPHFPKRTQHKCITTGNPIRDSLINGNKENLERFLNTKLTKPVIYATGGSLGARILNESLLPIISELAKKYTVIHQTGQTAYTDIHKYRNSLDPTTKKNYYVFDFIKNNLKDIYSEASLVISRSGAGTVNELNFFQIPSILIPLEPTRGDEQLKNAKWLKDKQSTIILKQNQLTLELLKKSITDLLKKTSKEKDSHKDHQESTNKIIEAILN